MINKNKIAGCIVAAGLLLTGCRTTFPELTEEDSDRIVNYAANLVLENSKSYESRLINLADYKEDVQVPAEPTPPSGMEPTADTETIDNSNDAGQYSSIQEFLGVPEIQITYMGNSVTESYPDTGESIGFALDATSGNKLLVMKFEVSNIYSEAVALDFFSHAARFKVSVNGAKSVNILPTTLTDDLNTYIGSIGVGETINLVLIAEVPVETEAVSSIKLTMRSDAGSMTTLLE